NEDMKESPENNGNTDRGEDLEVQFLPENDFGLKTRDGNPTMKATPDNPNDHTKDVKTRNNNSESMDNAQENELLNHNSRINGNGSGVHLPNIKVTTNSEHYAQTLSRSSSLSSFSMHSKHHFNGHYTNGIQKHQFTSTKSMTSSKKLHMLSQMVANGVFQIEDVVLAHPYMGVLKFHSTTITIIIKSIHKKKKKKNCFENCFRQIKSRVMHKTLDRYLGPLINPQTNEEQTQWPEWYLGLECFAWPNSTQQSSQPQSQLQSHSDEATADYSGDLVGVVNCFNGVHDSQKYFECDNEGNTRGLLIPIEYFTKIVGVWEIMRKLSSQKAVNEQLTKKLEQVTVAFDGMRQHIQEFCTSFFFFFFFFF
ncbi:hypothetical protein RFI_17440, partial [Reticulomyxa filosa]